MSGGVHFFLDGESATEEVGRRLADVLDAGSFAVALSGPLGAGKSTFARAVLRGLGISGPVPSPTYTLVEPYETRRGPVYHVDLYRVHGPEEVLSLALPEILDDGALLLVEWPERGARDVLAFDLDIRLEYAGAGREMEPRALTRAGRRALAAWRLGTP